MEGGDDSNDNGVEILVAKLLINGVVEDDTYDVVRIDDANVFHFFHRWWMNCIINWNKQHIRTKEQRNHKTKKFLGSYFWLFVVLVTDIIYYLLMIASTFGETVISFLVIILLSILLCQSMVSSLLLSKGLSTINNQSNTNANNVTESTAVRDTLE